MSQIDIKIQTTADTSGFKAASASATELERNIGKLGNGVNEVGRRMSHTADEWERGMRRIEHKFSGPDILREGLRGLGIGSGMQIAEKLAEKFAEHWKEAAEAAKAVAAASDKQLATTLEIIRLRQTDEQAKVTMEAERDRLQRRLDELNAPKYFDPKTPGVALANLSEGKAINAKRLRERTAEEQQEAQELANRITEIGKSLEEEKKKSAEKEKKASDTLAASEIANELAVQDAKEKADAETEKSLDAQAEKWVSLNNYLLQYRLDLMEIEKLHKESRLTAQEYARAIEEATRRRNEAQKADIDRRLTDFFGDAPPPKPERERDKTAAQRASEGYAGLSDPTQHLQGGQGVMAGIEDYLARVGTMADQVAAGIEDTLGAAVSGITDGIMGWVDGTKTFSQAISGIGQSVLRAMLQSLIQIGAQWVINKILVIAGIKTIDAVQDESRIANVAKTNAANLATMPGHLAGAAAAGISSFGLALIFGALAVALIASLAGGFAEGGYTAAGGRNDVAGVVHAGEWVAPGWMVNHPQFGGMIAGLESARNGGAGFGSIGGILTAPGFQPPSAGAAGTAHHIYLDREEFARVMQEHSSDYFHEIAARTLRQNA